MLNRWIHQTNMCFKYLLLWTRPALWTTRTALLWPQPGEFPDKIFVHWPRSVFHYMLLFKWNTHTLVIAYGCISTHYHRDKAGAGQCCNNVMLFCACHHIQMVMPRLVFLDNTATVFYCVNKDSRRRCIDIGRFEIKDESEKRWTPNHKSNKQHFANLSSFWNHKNDFLGSRVCFK